MKQATLPGNRWAIVSSVCIFVCFVLVAQAWDNRITHNYPTVHELAEARIAARSMAEMKSPSQSAKSSALATEEPATEEKKDENKNPEQGPSLTQIWAVREFFINIAGGVLCLGILVLMTVCCFTQRGCFVFDKYIDPDRHRQILDSPREVPVAVPVPPLQDSKV